MDPIIIVLVLAMGAMWFMTSRTRKQQRQVTDFRANLEVGQEVMTGSGLFGTIVAVDGDVITLESTPGNESRWLRAAIAKLVDPPVEDDAEDGEDAEYDAEYDEDAEYEDAEYDETDGVEQDDEPIEVPDDLSSLPPARGDDDPEQKKS
ncbi:preprotein translocase subunit YajC [Cellulomonas hominis]